MNIYVGNLSYDITEEDLKQVFEAYGEVASVNIIKDRDSGKSKGFGFVKITGKAKAWAAITGMNNKELKGKRIYVNKARPADDDFRGGGGRNFGRRF